jgi:outer membrane protein OmpA-like peptidoglycan-associated protein
MSMRTLLFMAAMFSTACAHQLQDPVGTTNRTPLPSDARSAPPRTASHDVEPKVAGESADPCGAAPPIVEFNGSSTEIDEAQVEELKRLAKCLNEAPHEKNSVVLIGYTDLIGTVAANLELGLTRAQVVMKHLPSGGVAPGRIVVASAGELQRPHARLGLHAPRVEVLIARGGLPRPNEAPITRGIDAEGLVPRQRQAAPISAPSQPSNAPQPARKR